MNDFGEFLKKLENVKDLRSQALLLRVRLFRMKLERMANNRQPNYTVKVMPPKGLLPASTSSSSYIPA